MFRISLSNATLLSVLYLLASVIIEAVRRFSHAAWAERASLSLELFPARVLRAVGAFEPLQRAYFEERLSGFQVRLLYALTSVALIFVSGVVVGAAMWGLARLTQKRE